MIGSVRRGLTGHLDLVCGLDVRGQAVLKRQSFSAPTHISKPHHDAGVLIVNLVNPTAGLLDGDRVEYRVVVENGARLMLTTPSASRIHRVRDGLAAMRQTMDVASGASLEFWPELLIPQGGARYRQQTQIHVEEGGELLFFESLAPGRVAAGESFEFRDLTWETDVWLGSRQIVRERYCLTPASESVRALRRVHKHAYYASGFVVAPQLGENDALWGAIHDMHVPDAWIGCGRLCAGGWVIKCVASGSIELRRILGDVRKRLYEALEREAPALRRT